MKMASTSEVTFGSRLQNAEQLLTHLQSFTGYAPPATDQSPEHLQTLVTGMRTLNTEAARGTQAYSAAVDHRQKRFQKDSDGLAKIVTPIAAAVRAAFGRDSKESADIAAMITKTRSKKMKKGSNAPDTKSISQSEHSYGSLTQTFANIIDTLESYGARYAPANDSIKIISLKRMLRDLIEANTAVTAAFGSLKQTKDDRAALYKTLSALGPHIKDAVKSQYGANSSEHALIKGLKL